MKRIFLLFIYFALCIIAINAQTVTLDLKGKITYIDDFNNILNDAVHVNDTLTGTILYYTNITDSNTDSTLGYYYNVQKPAGISINIDTINFKTDSSRIDLLVHTMCKPSNFGGNAILFRSDSNLFSVGSDYPNKIISWNLDDPFGTALNSDSLITKIDINQFEQNKGFTIQADSGVLNEGYFIRGIILEIIITTRDSDDNIVKIDSSIFADDTIIVIDSTLPAITDYDGNQYKTVKIGDQIWLRENLKSLHYADGTPIERVRVYDNNEENAEIYGRLYTWNVCMRGQYSSVAIPSGVQGVCPSGWHMPSDNEWYTLIKYLGGTAIAGGKMKEADTNHWENPNEGADNSSLLTVLPAGYISSGASFYKGYDAVFWTTAEYYGVDARYVFLDNTTTRGVIYNEGVKENNFSVRCIKNDNSFDTLIDNDTIDDGDTIVVALPTTIQYNSINIYPNPSGQIIFIDGLAHDGLVSVFDINGNVLIDRRSITNFIDIQQLHKGIYILRIEDKNRVVIKKIIKQ